MWETEKMSALSACINMLREQRIQTCVCVRAHHGPVWFNSLELSPCARGAEMTSIPSGDTADSSAMMSTPFGIRYRRLNWRVTIPEPS